MPRGSGISGRKDARGDSRALGVCDALALEGKAHEMVFGALSALLRPSDRLLLRINSRVDSSKM